MDNNNDANSKHIDVRAFKKKIKEELKKELLEEIYTELKSEEKEPTIDISKPTKKKTVIIEKSVEKPLPIEVEKSADIIQISVGSVLKIASHALKYANSKISRDEWVEVIGLLAGKLENGKVLHIEDAYPMGHGSAIYAEIKDYKNYVRAFNDIRNRNLFICGWYHSHPSYGLFMSTEDFGTQSRYQRLWKKSIALVIDPYMIDGTTFGFNIFKANLKTRKWFAVPFEVKGALSAKILPDLLKFIDPIIEGKAIYLEYDEE